MPTSTNVTNLKINELTEAQFDSAVSGGVIGANEISIITDLDEAIQVSTMPTAGADELGKVYQFIGTTDANYTHGYFYECVSDGATPPVYSWSQVNVQPTPSGGLQNTATGTDSLTILGTATTFSSAVNIGSGATTYAYGVAVGKGATSFTSGVAVGNGAQITGTGNINSVAIGRSALVQAARAVQIGAGTNPDDNTVKIANANGNYEMMSADGTIPTARLTKVNTTITLATADWSSNTQTVNVTGMTTTGVVMVSPVPADQSAYTSAGILCTAQGTNSLTFTATTTPSADIDVNIVCL